MVWWDVRISTVVVMDSATSLSVSNRSMSSGRVLIDKSAWRSCIPECAAFNGVLSSGSIEIIAMKNRRKTKQDKTTSDEKSVGPCITLIHELKLNGVYLTQVSTYHDWYTVHNFSLHQAAQSTIPQPHVSPDANWTRECMMPAECMELTSWTM